MIRTRLVDRPIDVAEVIRDASNTANGAVLLFLGTVRDANDGRPVTALDYSAYRGMAEHEMAAIAREAAERFNVQDLVIEHRLGELALGDASVAIAVGHPHRAAAYDASRYVIEELKRRVPIWKREHYVDGTREWVDPVKGRAGVHNG